MHQRGSARAPDHDGSAGGGRCQHRSVGEVRNRFGCNRDRQGSQPRIRRVGTHTSQVNRRLHRVDFRLGAPPCKQVCAVSHRAVIDHRTCIVRHDVRSRTAADQTEVPGFGAQKRVGRQRKLTPSSIDDVKQFEDSVCSSLRRTPVRGFSFDGHFEPQCTAVPQVDAIAGRLGNDDSPDLEIRHGVGRTNGPERSDFLVARQQ